YFASGCLFVYYLLFKDRNTMTENPGLYYHISVALSIPSRSIVRVKKMLIGVLWIEPFPTTSERVPVKRSLQKCLRCALTLYSQR
ncbi:MAG TPA: hypothetical protein PL062_10855, partial [Thermotogota bacterium]|nr:hypothetical protein [Thermotogota bacterium]